MTSRSVPRCSWVLVVGLYAGMLAGCDDASAREQDSAEATFHAFQDALFRRDSSALKELVCTDGREAVPAMCRQVDSDRLALEVTGVTRRNYDYLVHVRDPNEAGKVSHFVCTVEDGAMRVDLAATYREHAVETREILEREQFVPQKLTPEQMRDAEVVHASSGPKSGH